jgi:N-acylglucosamine 2-epimerase
VLLERQDIIDEAVRRAEEVMTSFRRPETKVLLEYVGTDGRPLDTPAGRAMVPGHAIESMWFMIHIYRHLGRPERIQEAVETIRWGLERGWDSDHGGIFLGIDVEGRKPVYWKNPETKIWWVFSEALYATLLAYEHSRASWCLDWYWKVHDWAFSHFPVQEHGEWTQRLDRAGNRIDTVIALPVKDPFHLPRALIWCIDVLERLKED